MTRGHTRPLTWPAYILVAIASLPALLVPAPAAARMATVVLAIAVGVAAARVWHPRGAWVSALVVAAGPTALLLDPLRALLAAAVLVATAWMPRARAAPGLLAGLAWPPLGILGAAHLPPTLLPLALLPAAVAVVASGSVLLAGPYILAALIAATAVLLRWVPPTPDSVRGLLHANLLAAGLLLVAATLLVDQLPGATTPARGVLQAVGLAVLVGLAAAQGAALTVVHRAGDLGALGWPAAGLGLLALSSAALLSVNVRQAQALGLALAVCAVQLAAVAPLAKRMHPAAWHAAMAALAGAAAAGAHWLPGAG